MDADLEEVGFLARSENRLEILQLLATEPRTRGELQAETEASRVTVGRILAEFERRGWIVSAEDGFHVTAVGRSIATELRTLRETIEAADVLGPLATALPAEFMTLDVRHFRDAELVHANESDPLAVARVAADLMDDADHVRILATAVTHDTVDAQIRAAKADGQESEVVLTTNTVEAIHAEEGLAKRLRTALAMDSVSIYETEESLPISMGIYDDTTVALGVIGDESLPTATLLSRDEVILSWARGTFERYCEAARRLHLDDFPE